MMIINIIMIIVLVVIMRKDNHNNYDNDICHFLTKGSRNDSLPFLCLKQ